MSSQHKHLVVVGHGPVGHRLLEELAKRNALVAEGGAWTVTVIGEETRPAYDRVHLTAWFDGTDLDLTGGFFDGRPGAELVLGDGVVAVERTTRQVMLSTGRAISYDVLVLATGSSPFVPPVAGSDLPQCFVYRTIDDLEAITARAAEPGVGVGAVIGGGLLGLEAADALRRLGLETHVVEFAPRLMPVQVDEGGGATLKAHVEALGLHVHCGASTTEVTDAGLHLADGSLVPAQLVVFSAGIRPRDELARAAGLAVGERGGIAVDEACCTEDAAIYAIGECAHAAGRTWGLVAPGFAMARAVAERLAGGGGTFHGADLSTKLKLLGVDVASVGDAHAATPGADCIAFTDPVSGTYRKVVVGPAPALGSPRPVIGGVLVGCADGYEALCSMVRGDLPSPADPAVLVFPASLAGVSAADESGPGALSPSALVCSCNGVTKGDLCSAIAADDIRDIGGLKKATTCGTGCGGCVPLATRILNMELSAAGVDVSTDLCEHFAFTRQELYDLVRVRGYRTFGEVLASHGKGRGCHICRPAVASILASNQNEHPLRGDRAAAQDTNDHHLANLQKDGTYSIVPRMPGGLPTAEQLIVIGEIARDYRLQVKVTGGQRIDLFGATPDQLPAIWERMVAAGLESGHAYAKALRTVKSCVGTDWCRYGVGDSTAMAIRLELRYRGLRAPHKIKMAVSGCARECAEAQSKDLGVIATERGWNLYVCGNGGQRPRHAELLAEDLDDDTLVRYADRFLGYYLRTAERLERTAPWLERIEGGIEHLKEVVVDDSLGLGSELEAAMSRHVDTYEDEWAAVLRDPELLARFRTHINVEPARDPGVGAPVKLLTKAGAI